MRHAPILALVLALGCAASPQPNRCGTTAGCSRDTLSSLSIVQVRREPTGFVLAGEGIEVGTLYALVGGEPSGLVRVVGGEPTDCDHCPGPRYRTEQEAPSAHPLLALGPVLHPLERARAHVVGEALPADRRWRRELTVDIDGDGRDELERVVRCEHYVPSGCSGEVCDRICRATRTVGEDEARAVSCENTMPDVDDCEPS